MRMNDADNKWNARVCLIHVDSTLGKLGLRSVGYSSSGIEEFLRKHYSYVKKPVISIKPELSRQQEMMIKNAAYKCMNSVLFMFEKLTPYNKHYITYQILNSYVIRHTQINYANYDLAWSSIDITQSENNKHYQRR